MKYEEIVDYVNEILDQYSMPLTLRQVFYRLVASYEYPNKSSAYSQLSVINIEGSIVNNRLSKSKSNRIPKLFFSRFGRGKFIFRGSERKVVKMRTLSSIFRTCRGEIDYEFGRIG